YICSNCHSAFSKYGDSFKLVKGKYSISFWNKYAKKLITVDEWLHIRETGMSFEETEEADKNTYLSELISLKKPITFRMYPSIILLKDEQIYFDLPNIVYS